MNILNKPDLQENIAELFHVLGQPVRVQILLGIGQQEVCVCHLEAFLGLRQAAISQHLMVLRDAGLVTTQREGRNIYYRLSRPEVLDLVSQAGQMVGITAPELANFASQPVFPCPCPHCNPDKTNDPD